MDAMSGFLAEKYREKVYPMLRGAYSDEDQAVVLARAVGVKIGDKFRISGLGGDVFRIARTALLERLDTAAHVWHCADPEIVVALLGKKCDISLCPYAPVKGDCYFRVCWTGGNGPPYVARFVWRGDDGDCLSWFCENFFQTEHEARGAMECVFKKYSDNLFEELNRSDLRQC